MIKEKLIEKIKAERFVRAEEVVKSIKGDTLEERAKKLCSLSQEIAREFKYYPILGTAFYPTESGDRELSEDIRRAVSIVCVVYGSGGVQFLAFLMGEERRFGMIDSISEDTAITFLKIISKFNCSNDSIEFFKGVGEGVDKRTLKGLIVKIALGLLYNTRDVVTADNYYKINRLMANILEISLASGVLTSQNVAVDFLMNSNIDLKSALDIITTK